MSLWSRYTGCTEKVRAILRSRGLPEVHAEEIALRAMTRHAEPTPEFVVSEAGYIEGAAIDVPLFDEREEEHWM